MNASCYHGPENLFGSSVSAVGAFKDCSVMWLAGTVSIAATCHGDETEFTVWQGHLHSFTVLPDTKRKQGAVDILYSSK
jgi:hypothetical protein